MNNLAVLVVLKFLLQLNSFPHNLNFEIQSKKFHQLKKKLLLWDNNKVEETMAMTTIILKLQKLNITQLLRMCNICLKIKSRHIKHDLKKNANKLLACYSELLA